MLGSRMGFAGGDLRGLEGLRLDVLVMCFLDFRVQLLVPRVPGLKDFHSYVFLLPCLSCWRLWTRVVVF